MVYVYIQLQDIVILVEYFMKSAAMEYCDRREISPINHTGMWFSYCLIGQILFKGCELLAFQFAPGNLNSSAGSS